MKRCLNPECRMRCYEQPHDDEPDRCPKCGTTSCEACGSFWDNADLCSDTCVYCRDTGIVDCDMFEVPPEKCEGCGDPCEMLAEHREAFLRDMYDDHRMRDRRLASQY